MPSPLPERRLVRGGHTIDKPKERLGLTCRMTDDMSRMKMDRAGSLVALSCRANSRIGVSSIQNQATKKRR
jgi:hypothetical protein